MSDRTTINVTKDAHQKAKEAKKDDESWSDYITRCIDAERDVSNDDIDTKELARAVSKQVDYTEIASKTAREVAEELQR